MTDFRALCARMADELDRYRQLLTDDRRETHALAAEARAHLATEPQGEGPADPNDPPAPICVKDLATQWNQQADEFNQWDNLGTEEQLLWAQARAIAVDRARWGRPAAPQVDAPTDQQLADTFAEGCRYSGRSGEPPFLGGARAVLARYGRPAPPPADREVAEVITALRAMAVDADLANQISDAENLDYAAALLQQQHDQPVPVSERLPEAHRKVLAHYFNSHGKGRTICAVWVPAKSRSDSGGEEDFTEYDEETDTFYWPEGWYEVIENWDDLGYVKVYEGDVSQWQPLPQWPTLPLPISGEVQP